MMRSMPEFVHYLHMGSECGKMHSMQASFRLRRDLECELLPSLVYGCLGCLAFDHQTETEGPSGRTLARDQCCCPGVLVGHRVCGASAQLSSQGNTGTYSRSFNFSLSTVITLLFVSSSTRAMGPLVSLMIPT